MRERLVPFPLILLASSIQCMRFQLFQVLDFRLLFIESKLRNVFRITSLLLHSDLVTQRTIWQRLSAEIQKRTRDLKGSVDFSILREPENVQVQITVSMIIFEKGQDHSLKYAIEPVVFHMYSTITRYSPSCNWVNTTPIPVLLASVCKWKGIATISLKFGNAKIVVLVKTPFSQSNACCCSLPQCHFTLDQIMEPTARPRQYIPE